MKRVRLNPSISPSLEPLRFSACRLLPFCRFLLFSNCTRSRTIPASEGRQGTSWKEKRVNSKTWCPIATTKINLDTPHCTTRLDGSSFERFERPLNARPFVCPETNHTSDSSLVREREWLLSRSIWLNDCVMSRTWYEMNLYLVQVIYSAVNN